jgi:hypothetical protein
LEEEEYTSKTVSAKNKRKRRRMMKCRNIVIDNNQTELTSEQMKSMLRDTSDIVMQNVPHLAAWPRDDVDEEEDAHLGICPALQCLSAEQLLARPCIGDDGGLAPELLALWGRNMCKIIGNAGTQLPFRMRGTMSGLTNQANGIRVNGVDDIQAINRNDDTRANGADNNRADGADRANQADDIQFDDGASAPCQWCQQQQSRWSQHPSQPSRRHSSHQQR